MYKDESKTLESTRAPKNAKMLADQGMFNEMLGELEGAEQEDEPSKDFQKRR